MMIYYPQNGKAFRVRSRQKIEMPIIPQFLMALKMDYGLADLGYRLEEHAMRSDTLETVWRSGLKIGNSGGKAVLRSAGDRLLSMEMKNGAGQTVSRVEFDNFTRIPSGGWFPRKLVMWKKSPDQFSREVVTLESVRFDEALPDSIKNYRIPPGAQIEEKEW